MEGTYSIGVGSNPIRPFGVKTVQLDVRSTSPVEYKHDVPLMTENRDTINEANLSASMLFRLGPKIVAGVEIQNPISSTISEDITTVEGAWHSTNDPNIVKTNFSKTNYTSTLSTTPIVSAKFGYQGSSGFSLIGKIGVAQATGITSQTTTQNTFNAQGFDPLGISGYNPRYLSIGQINDTKNPVPRSVMTTQNVNTNIIKNQAVIFPMGVDASIGVPVAKNSLLKDGADYTFVVGGSDFIKSIGFTPKASIEFKF